MSNQFAQSIKDLPKDLQASLLDELNRIARRYMQAERAGHTLQATALVNEAYVNLAEKSIMVSDKKHFIAIAAQKMRRILVDHARTKIAAKRGCMPIMLTLSEQAVDNANDNINLIYLDQLMSQLAEFDERGASIFELKMFSSITNEEVAELFSISVATVERDLKAAKAWLKTQMPSASNDAAKSQAGGL